MSLGMGGSELLASTITHLTLESFVSGKGHNWNYSAKIRIPITSVCKSQSVIHSTHCWSSCQMAPDL